MGTEPDLIENRVLEKLREVCQNSRHPDLSDRGGWGTAIRKALASLADSLQYKPYYRGAKSQRFGEWVYDMIWTQEDEKGELVSVALAMEDEWELGLEAISDDFQKLLLVRAPHRLMVYRAANQQEYKDRTDALIEKIKAFKLTQNQDRYLLICRCSRPRKVFARLHVHGASPWACEIEYTDV